MLSLPHQLQVQVIKKSGKKKVSFQFIFLISESSANECTPADMHNCTIEQEST